jgi:glycosyltransferase involved in cell wall biosynthesis
MVATAGIKELLERRGFNGIVIWARGVRTDVFLSDIRKQYELPRPIWINVGRVSVEKNIESFLQLDLPGSKVIIGDGPDRERLSKTYTDCVFLGYRFGSDLAEHLAGADVFVFPSRTDTFGLVMLEAMACGLPVAAYPVCGPIDVVRHRVTGVLAQDLARACLAALELDRNSCRAFAESRSWAQATRQFISHLAEPGVEAHPLQIET